MSYHDPSSYTFETFVKNLRVCQKCDSRRAILVMAPLVSSVFQVINCPECGGDKGWKPGEQIGSIVEAGDCYPTGYMIYDWEGNLLLPC